MTYVEPPGRGRSSPLTMPFKESPSNVFPSAKSQIIFTAVIRTRLDWLKKRPAFGVCRLAKEKPVGERRVD